MPIATVRPTTWGDLIEALYASAWNESLGRYRLPYAFRGHPRVDEDLSSSLVRLAAARPNGARLELHLLRNFRKYAYGQTGADTIWDWLALGQHRGLPTRLLDWTYSPLVALHFATEAPEDMDRDGIVWCVNFVEANKRLPPKLKRIMQGEGSETLTIDMLNAVGDM